MLMAFKYTHEQFLELVYEQVKDEYSFLGTFNGKSRKVEVVHNACGHEYSVTPYHFLDRKQRCPKCNKGRKRTVDEYKKEFYERAKEEYELLSDYQGARKNVKIKHLVCGTIYESGASDFKYGAGCLVCAQFNFHEKRKKTHERFEEEVLEKGFGEYKATGNYKGDNEYISMVHLECGTEYEVVPSAFIQGIRCPRCKVSKGEDFIHRLLDEMDIRYKAQYRFLDCVRKRPLPFDFALIGDCGNVYAVIEYHGIQHYEAVDFFGGKEKLKFQKENDTIKEDYCKVRNITYIEIPYLMDEEQITNIISNYANHEPSNVGIC